MKLTIVGSGDAFGSGGRLQTCYHVSTGAHEVLVDCGATAMIGLERQRLDPNRISTIYISHLHGDHFAGLVWFMLHAEYVARRSTPLVIVGPRDVEARYRTAAEALFPGSGERRLRFQLEFYEHVTSLPLEIGPVTSQAFEVDHPSGAPSYALRLSAEGRVLAFSGDTAWVPVLRDVAAGSHLYISECYAYERDVPHHMSWQRISGELPALDCERILLTHMGPEMLPHASGISDPRVIVAEDGLVLEV